MLIVASGPLSLSGSRLLSRTCPLPPIARCIALFKFDSTTTVPSRILTVIALPAGTSGAVSFGAPPRSFFFAGRSPPAVDRSAMIGRDEALRVAPSGLAWPNRPAPKPKRRPARAAPTPAAPTPISHRRPGRRHGARADRDEEVASLADAGVAVLPLVLAPAWVPAESGVSGPRSSARPSPARPSRPLPGVGVAPPARSAAV